MLKYVDTKVVFQEVPNEITLAISISGCKIGCKDCHSSYLAKDIGSELNKDTLKELIDKNIGITCIAFMGGDNDIPSLYKLASWIKSNTSLKVCWYSGNEIRNDVNLWDFDFIKTGRYIKERGPLTSKTTNQRFYKVFHTTMGKGKLIDITSKFWRDND